MAVEQTPIIRDADHDKLLYRGFAMAQMRILKDYMAQSGLNSYSRVVTLANGVVITCKKSFNREDIMVSAPTIPFTDKVVKQVMLPLFICTPRIFGENDGYKESAEGLVSVGTGAVDYPLTDGDSTSMALTWGSFASVPAKENLTGADVGTSRAPQLYGNIDWVGVNPSADVRLSTAPVLTWRGPTGRSLPCDLDTFIDGLTVTDIEFDGQAAPKQTCFGKYIYEGGDVAYEAVGSDLVDIEPKVLGAAYHGSTLVCVVNNHYSGVTGFFEEVWLNNGDKALYSTEHPDGWRKIGSRAVGRPTEIWAFNQSGTRATQGIKEYIIDYVNFSAIQVSDDGGSGTYTINKSEVDAGDPESAYASTGTTTITHEGAYKLYSDYVGDERVFASIRVVDRTQQKVSTNTTKTKADALIYTPGSPTEADYIIRHNGDSGLLSVSISVGSAFTVTGTSPSCCPDSNTYWDFSDGEIGDNGVITSITSLCGKGTVSATVCGKPVTRNVRWGTGVWCAISDNIFNSNWSTQANYTGAEVNIEDGAVKYQEWGNKALATTIVSTAATPYWTPSVTCSCSNLCGYPDLVYATALTCSPISHDSSSMIGEDIWPGVEPQLVDTIGSGAKQCSNHALDLEYLVLAQECIYVYRRITYEWKCTC